MRESRYLIFEFLLADWISSASLSHLSPLNHWLDENYDSNTTNLLHRKLIFLRCRYGLRIEATKCSLFNLLSLVKPFKNWNKLTIFKEYDLVGKATKRVTLQEKKLFFTTNSLITQILLQAINKINQDMLELGASFLVLQCQMMRKLQEKGYLLGQGTYLLRHIQGVPC